MRLHISEWARYKLRPATFFETDEGEGIMSIGVANFGSIFQLVSDSLQYQMGSSHKRVFTYWFKPLYRQEPALRASWWMRRGKRFFPWWLLWQLSSASEWLAIRFLRLTYRAGFWDPPTGARINFQYWRWRWWLSRRNVRA